MSMFVAEHLATNKQESTNIVMEMLSSVLILLSRNLLSYLFSRQLSTDDKLSSIIFGEAA